MSKNKVLDMIKDDDVDYVDIRFTDPRGKLQHVTIVADLVDEDFIEEGFMFDGSSIAGWKSIEASDMKLMLDTESAYIDPFYAEKTLCVHCSVVEPDTGEAYERDPRGTAQKAEAYLKASGIGDVAYMGPEAEFFLFDDVRFSNSINKVSYEVDATDASWNTDTEYEMGNMGHRPGVKGGYFPVNPTDEAQDLRSEMLSTMKRLGMKVDKHHHEVASCQHELGLIFDSLTKQADELQKYKYVIHNVAHAYGKTATFMPKPIAGDNGTGMHRPEPGSAVLYRRHPETRQIAERVHQPGNQQLQTPDPGFRSAGAARLFGPQPLGLCAYSVDRKPQGKTRRSALPRSGSKPLSGVRGIADGRP